MSDHSQQMATMKKGLAQGPNLVFVMKLNYQINQYEVLENISACNLICFIRCPGHKSIQYKMLRTSKLAIAEGKIDIDFMPKTSLSIAYLS